MISFVESEKEYKKLIEILEDCHRFAFYCATFNKDKNSPISIATIDTEAKGMFVVDVQLYGLDKRIQKIFSNPEVMKIMFDCRRDSDSLYYAYGTILNGVVDLQIMDYVIKYSEKAGHPIGTLLAAVEEYFGCFAGKKLKAAKQKMAVAQEQEYDWLEGPSRQELVEYLTEEIRWFFPIFYELTAKYKKSQPKLTAEKIAEVQFYSSMYAASCTSHSSSKTQDPYQNHRFMPWGIFQPRPIGDIQCTGCKLYFPKKDCQDLQFEPGEQKCTVCKAVRLGLLNEKQTKELLAYNPDLEHVNEFKVRSLNLPAQMEVESENDTDDSGVSLPDEIPSHQLQNHLTFPHF